jgi:hypothetical protein
MRLCAELSWLPSVTQSKQPELSSGVCSRVNVTYVSGLAPAESGRSRAFYRYVPTHATSLVKHFESGKITGLGSVISQTCLPHHSSQQVINKLYPGLLSRPSPAICITTSDCNEATASARLGVPVSAEVSYRTQWHTTGANA